MNISSVGSSYSYGTSRMERPQGPPPSSEEFATKLLEDLDTDGNGSLSTEEVSASDHAELSEMLGAADADGDGLLTKSELVAHAEERAKEFGDRSTWPPKGLDKSTELDFSSLIASMNSASSSYGESSSIASLLEYSSSLDLAG